MKLRNKKTGEIGRLYFDHQLIDPKTGTYAIVIQHRDKLGYEAFANYFTLAELNAEWEDYEPAEPLIKDEKIRKAVRAWAEANRLDSLPIHYDSIYNRFCDAPDFSIAINFCEGVKGELNGGYSYYLNELCGEEDA